jgi:hypothetical protein
MKLFRCYWLPTPKKWRMFGDTLLAVSTFANTFEIARDNHKIAIAILTVGVIGKFLTNCKAKKNAKSN